MPTNAEKLTIPAARSGERITVESIPGGQVSFEFDPTVASFIREGDSLVITAENGGVIVLENFFIVGESALPEFILPDSTVIASADLLASLNPDLDLSTAAGPSSPTSGGTSYEDDPGNLLGGLDKLGKLGTDQWSRDTELAEVIPEVRILSAVITTPPSDSFNKLS